MTNPDDHKLDQILGVLEIQGKLLETQGHGLALIQEALTQHTTTLSRINDTLSTHTLLFSRILERLEAMGRRENRIDK